MTKEEFYERYLKGDYEIFNAWEDGLTGQCDMVVKDDDGTPWSCRSDGMATCKDPRWAASSTGRKIP